MTDFMNDIWGGWLYLLPDLKAKDVLLVSPPSATLVKTVAEHATRVTCLGDSRMVTDESLISSVEYIPFQNYDEFALLQGRFGLIICFVEGERLSQVDQLSQHLSASLEVNGSLYLQLHNPVRYSGPWWRRVHWSYFYWRHLLNSRSLVNEQSLQQSYAVSLRRGQVASGQISNRYHSVQNSFLYREKFKQALLRGRIAGIGSEGWVEIYSNNVDFSTQYEQVVSRAVQLAGLTHFEVTNVLILNQACIVLIDSRATPAENGDENVLPGVVAVVCSSAHMLARRQRELALLARLREHHPKLRPLISLPIGTEQVGSMAVCFQQRMEGVTIEVNFPGLSRITEQAVVFLRTLLEASSAPVPVDRLEVDRVLNPLLDRALQRTPTYSTKLTRLAVRLREQLPGQSIPRVVMHGDFKIENLVFSGKPLGLSGVIDWDLGDDKGFPFLDLWYLLIYNRHIRHQQNIFDAYIDLLVAEDLSLEEQGFVDLYAGSLDLGTVQLWCLKAVFLFFHIGNRSDLSNATPEYLARFEQALESAITGLDNCAATITNCNDDRGSAA